VADKQKNTPLGYRVDLYFVPVWILQILEKSEESDENIIRVLNAKKMMTKGKEI
jgi:hypothetical protein